MPAPTHEPALYLRSAFVSLHWQHLAFEAAMAEPARRDIIEFIALEWPKRPMQNVISTSHIDLLATDAARRGDTLRLANPYPAHSPPGGLFARCFAAEQQRLARALQAQAESVYTDD